MEQMSLEGALEALREETGWKKFPSEKHLDVVYSFLERVPPSSRVNVLRVCAEEMLEEAFGTEKDNPYLPQLPLEALIVVSATVAANVFTAKKSLAELSTN